MSNNNNITRLIRESKDLASNESLAVVSYYFDLYMLDILIKEDYEDKNYIVSLLDKVELYQKENFVPDSTENNSKLDQVIKFNVIVYKRNLDLSKGFLTGSDDASVDISEVIQSIWLNIDLIDCVDNLFEIDFKKGEHDGTIKDLLEKFNSSEKLKTLKLLLKKLLILSKEQKQNSKHVDEEDNDEKMLKKQLEEFEEKEEDNKDIKSTPDFEENDNGNENTKSVPDFEDENEIDNTKSVPEFEDEDIPPPILSKTTHSASSIKLPTPPKHEEAADDTMITKNINSTSSESDYDSSEISEIITTQETIDSMVKLAKVGIQCIQYEDLIVAKENFKQLLSMLEEEIAKL
ncbi:hypothetical protein HANVADRAFT_53142 [Hanseniaspora valbyensis NRRL Y-1626]|uniref:Uncharacterized protein n=1 Tax=Hanseniaspora valbyensis NRRL Y-1626 TaxID=766949 RepID=A0A1B7TCD3_9ASCO|nr:hypothetical protein HANVADRAFT_53142 [Hanseniaspora valbyensis NRRL Y-1626]